MNYASIASFDTNPFPTLPQWIIFGIEVIALGVLGYFAIYCLRQLRTTMDQKGPSIETSWGGLGGGMGGWTVSKSLVWFVTTLASIILFGALAFHVGDSFQVSAQKENQERQKNEASPSTSSKETSAPPAEKIDGSRPAPDASAKTQGAAKENNPENKK